MLLLLLHIDTLGTDDLIYDDDDGRRVLSPLMDE